MANELGILIEDRLLELGWSVSRLTLESGLSADVVVDLVGREQLPAMPDAHTLRQLSTSLDLPYRQMVVAAGVACGLPKNQEGEPTFALRFATNQELLNELRRRLVRGHGDAGSQHQRRTHLALVKQVLAHEAG
ncbi:hypothetical protein BJ986_001963 [Phycicoccus badiiscoriae]|uniref:Uncharacterized protein n=1 Tax=Pedococcus badiiscoriae TaxID=642776 RepID=A0A852WQ66_9MICO|nr:hypothetical protein [Pedococcus badiiscoriae]NYG07476.1 hypothetical protein [Pedococcus badiiscoriae]